MAYPILKTNRLTLRPFQRDDEAALYAFASDPDVVRYMSWGPNTPAESRSYLHYRLSEQKRNPTEDYVFAVTLVDDGRLIGSCGLRVEDKVSAEASIGYILHKDEWGKGYATEAARRLLEFGFNELGMHRIYATCRPENTGSSRILEKLGMRHEAHFRKHLNIRGEWQDSFLYAILKEEYMALPVEAVVFDMDGVLINSEPVYYESNREILEQFGISIEEVNYNRFVGISAENMWETIRSEHGLSTAVPDLVRMEEDGMLHGLQKSRLAPMPGLIGVLDRLAEAGVPLALASSSPRQVIHLILSKLDLEGRFRAVVSGEDVTNGKPAPDIFLQAARLLDVRPEKCLVIEDSANGVRSAKAAGMHCIGFRNPYSGLQDVSPADWIVEGFNGSAIARIMQLVSQDSRPSRDREPVHHNR